jgi:hypothetical protein
MAIARFASMNPICLLAGISTRTASNTQWHYATNANQTRRSGELHMSNNVKLTRRGRIVLWILILTAIIAFSHITRDICWTGSGYGSCQDFVNTTVEGSNK